ncbi:GTPase [Olavius algarvensis spirochete endosymbiont]|uniref:GTPase n=1 Tax=Olavius algarvensis spirochete endosymbiont TaxID=260710 RepID=UPI000F519DF2|nr:GTPase [Olavius algarvensis spirochete endosymbiont]
MGGFKTLAMLVERDYIGIFGEMNVGKSSVMNLLTQQNTSLVDATPGTTADTKISLLEIHGIGPVKLFDTAGLDEKGELGNKKRKKVYSDLKECDLALVVIDPSSYSFEVEEELIERARDMDKQILIIKNLFSEDKEVGIPLLKFYKKIAIKANDDSYRQRLLNFVIDNFESRNKKQALLPFVEREEYYVLNIPMDVETPPGRYLRPQAMTEEYITRNWAYPVSFRMDLNKARSERKKEEKQRFLSFIDNFKKGPEAIITDSQAMDIMAEWVPADIKLTTFSIAMINYFSRGKLRLFVQGLKVLKELEEEERVLIVEACNHSRVGEDIGTVQIPNYFREKFPGVVLEHNFGREFQENEQLSEYKLIIHCGGCMISSQELNARIRDVENLQIPFTNYGLLLSYIQGDKALRKVLEPWGLASA